MMLQFCSPTSISPYYFVLVAHSRQTGRSYNSIPGDDVGGVVVVAVAASGVAIVAMHDTMTTIIVAHMTRLADAVNIVLLR